MLVCSQPRSRRFVRGRISMNLPDALLESVKRRAQADGRTVTSLVEQALREWLADEPDEEFDELPVWSPSDARLLIDINDKAALWEALDADRFT